MKSPPLGASISIPEVSHIDGHAIWVLLEDNEYFLSYADFPWFKKARIEQILNVQVLHGFHLYWPDLDVDLTIESIEYPERFPNVAVAGEDI